VFVCVVLWVRFGSIGGGVKGRGNSRGMARQVLIQWMLIATISFLLTENAFEMFFLWMAS
jgi:hypothetical protein